jgi:uncharacterized protein (TIGR02145 family)
MQPIFISLKPIVFVLVLAGLFSCKKDDASTPNNPTSTTVTDIDGNTYNTVTIGNQVWMKENLKVSKYRNGDFIPTNVSDSLWPSIRTGAYAILNNDLAKDSIYGKLYNWYAVVDPRGFCPEGWHVPTDHDWNILTKYLDPKADTGTVLINSQPNSTTAGGYMKAVSYLWRSPNTGASNSSGFNALPGGQRNFCGSFWYIGETGEWWSSTECSTGSCSSETIKSSAWSCSVSFGHAASRRNYTAKPIGLSVRCIRD